MGRSITRSMLGPKGKELTRNIQAAVRERVKAPKTKATEFGAKHQEEEDEWYLKELFSIGDANGAGVLTKTELRNLLQLCGFEFSDQEINKFISEADTDKDGVINYEEFVPTGRRRMNLATRKFVPGEIIDLSKDEPKIDLSKDEPQIDLSKDEPKDLTSEGLVAKTQCGSKSWQDTPAAALPQEPASVLAHPANAFQYSACHRYGVERDVHFRVGLEGAAHAARIGAARSRNTGFPQYGPHTGHCDTRTPLPVAPDADPYWAHQFATDADMRPVGIERATATNAARSWGSSKLPSWKC